MVIGSKTLNAEAELVKVANALDLLCTLFGAEQSWKQQGRQNADDRNYDQQL